jgi:pimeloyl-ACP methyl ester carboxylesterase
MKTLLSSGFLGCLSLALFACAGGDDEVAAGAAGTSAADGTGDVLTDDVSDDAVDPTQGATSEASAETAPGDPVEAPSDAATIPEVQVIPTLEVTDLAWRSCGQFDDRDLECAEVLVPIDYDQPDGEQLPIALRRILANPLEPYKGALLINPGGPGGRGIDFALDGLQGGLFDAVAPGYDIIGFDPRGVGDSGERGCGILPEDLYPALVDGEEVASAVETQLARIRERGEQCEQAWGPLLHQLGSKNVVRDMEEIRKALRQPFLHYYGASYGTRLGALYAHMFPATAGRMVLDASVLPRASLVESVRGQFYETVALHERLFVVCDEQADLCPPDARAVFEQMLTTSRERGYESVFIAVWRNLLGVGYGPDELVYALNAEAADPGGAWFEEFLASYLGDDGGAGEVALSTVHCIDDIQEPPSVAEVESLYAEFNAVNPLYASAALPTINCAGWPTTRDPLPTPTALDIAQPVLVIGGVADWRTPYEWAAAMTEALGKATLLTSEHFGHGAVPQRGQCVLSTVRAYFTSGSMPATGAVCSSTP